MTPWQYDLLKIFISGLLVLINGFFFGAEFAWVKIREPAEAYLLRPIIFSLGITSEILVHGATFTIVFTAITEFHVVIGGQAPKIAALRRPETSVLWGALPLKFLSIYPIYSWPLIFFPPRNLPIPSSLRRPGPVLSRTAPFPV